MFCLHATSLSRALIRVTAAASVLVLGALAMQRLNVRQIRAQQAPQGNTPACSLPISLPQAIAISPPAAGLAPSLAAFSGDWEGTWDVGGLSANHLAVLQIDDTQAQLLAASTSRDGSGGGWGHITAQVADDHTLKPAFGPAAMASVSISADLSSLTWTYQTVTGATATNVLHRCAPQPGGPLHPSAAGGGGATQGCEVTTPLPPVLQVAPPTSDVSPQVAGMTGVWEGTWGTTGSTEGTPSVDSLLIVEQVSGTTATVVYAFRVADDRAANWFRLHVQELSNGALLLQFPNPGGSTVLFSLSTDGGSIYAASAGSDGSSAVKLTGCALS